MKGAAPSRSTFEKDPMAAWLDEYAPPRPCRRGDIMKGVVVRADPKGFLVDIGAKCDAMVAPREVERMAPEELEQFKPGQSLYVYIVDNDDMNNTILVSLARAVQEQDWEEALRLLDSKEVVELEVMAGNKGGVIVHMGKLRGFVPSSQMLPGWRSLQKADDPDRRWDAMIGKTLKLRVIEVTPERNRLILSERLGRDRQDKKVILRELKPGAIETGVVNNVVDFGAFVNVKGIDGLLHISELSWQRVTHPSEIIKAGQKIQVYILDVNLERERLNLSLKRLQADPWEGIESLYEEGQLIEVEIVNLTSFGAFACPIDNPAIEGLIHISELSDQPVTRADEVVQVGMRTTARIISLRAADRRIAFSLKRAMEGESAEPEPTPEEQETASDAE